MRKLLIRILFRLIGRKDHFIGIDEEAIKDFLSTAYKHPGFREYIRKRDLTLLRTFGNGLDPEKAESWLGQRFEIMKLMDTAKKASKAKEKEQKERDKQHKRSKNKKK